MRACPSTETADTAQRSVVSAVSADAEVDA